MTPRIVRGRSFKGVVTYLRHDKGAKTSNRVTFVETVNLHTDNIDSALAHMIDTATHADDLKRMAGVSTKGRKQEKPVYHYILPWHPSEEVTEEIQMEAARETMKILGLDERQAFVFGHDDTDHPHIHVVANLVSPEDGRFPSLSKDYDKLSKWALDYEKRRGVVFCPQREKNQARRRDGEFVKDQSPSRQEWMEWKKAQAKELWDQFRADKAAAKPARKAQFDALWQQKENRIAQRREEIKRDFKPQWSKLFKRQRAELQDFDAGFFDRLGFAFGRKNRSKIVGLLQAITGDGDLRAEFLRDQDAQKKQLADQHKGVIRDAARVEIKAYKYDRGLLIESLKHQDQLAYDETKAKTAAIFEIDESQDNGSDEVIGGDDHMPDDGFFAKRRARKPRTKGRKRKPRPR